MATLSRSSSGAGSSRRRVASPSEAPEGEVARLRLRTGRRAAPLNLYFDTSALIKLVVAEDGSELAAELWGTRNPAASSILAYPEGRAALAAAQGGGRLTAADHAKAVADFEALQEELVLVGIDLALAREAGDLAEALGLRGYDAVHLASALALGDPTTVVAWDEALRGAAASCGCTVGPAG